MKILIINTGSSSIKYQLLDMDQGKVLVSGMAEKIGETISTLNHVVTLEKGDNATITMDIPIRDHREGMIQIVNILGDARHGVIHDKKDIAAVGHRVVHGGEVFKTSTIIDEKVISAIRDNIPLAPLHNPHNLTGIEVALSIFPDSPQVAVFDTAFHQSLPEKAFLYALPYRLYQKNKIRRYGFHGTSHSYVAEKCADFLGRRLNELKLITIHLGNGASMAAIEKGRSVDTSMGMTPLEGLVMGTRSGDVDPALPFHLSDHLNMPLDDINTLLNEKSGLKGICGANDMREVIQRMEKGDRQAILAHDVYCYRIKKYIGAYFAVLGDLDSLVFTGGIGENAPSVREGCCQGLTRLGIEIDSKINHARGTKLREISSLQSDVKVLVIPTNEERIIAQETWRLVSRRRAEKTGNHPDIV
ncbi:MAG: acetate kinase [Desulfatiglans sp.]|jgi:acetate kinase|nr:acetate kinase [Thermodesulfobacteriota bacterium]MEE4353699.1 acetate kinase [Desulfatiglans sp.]